MCLQFYQSTSIGLSNTYLYYNLIIQHRFRTNSFTILAYNIRIYLFGVSLAIYLNVKLCVCPAIKKAAINTINVGAEQPSRNRFCVYKAPPAISLKYKSNCMCMCVRSVFAQEREQKIAVKDARNASFIVAKGGNSIRCRLGWRCLLCICGGIGWLPIDVLYVRRPWLLRLQEFNIWMSTTMRWCEHTNIDLKNTKPD